MQRFEAGAGGGLATDLTVQIRTLRRPMGG